MKLTNNVHLQRTYNHDIWESDLEVVECGVCSGIEPVVYIRSDVNKKVRFLMNKYKDVEWACDLLGYKEENNIIVTDIHIFEQEVTATSVTRKASPHPDSIGMLHSHYNMGTFFSHMDNDSNMNWELGGVVSNKGGSLEYLFNVRMRTECGRYTNVSPEVVVEDDVIEIPEKELRKIKEKRTTL